MATRSTFVDDSGETRLSGTIGAPDASASDVLTADGAGSTSWASGGGSLEFGFWGLYNTGPYGGIDDAIPLTPYGPGLGDTPGDAIAAQTSFGFPVTIGAGGGFTLFCRLPQAFVAANPDLNLYGEFVVSNHDGTEKADVAVYSGTSGSGFLGFVNGPGGQSVPDLTGFQWSVHEQVGSDLSHDVYADFYDTGLGAPRIKSAAGGQLFAGGWIQLQGFAT